MKLREDSTILNFMIIPITYRRFLEYVMAFLAENEIYHFHQVTLKKNKLRDLTSSSSLKL